MSIITIRRQRSPGWWTVILCACLAMAVYIAFEVLDLDGSKLRDLGPGTAVAAEPAAADADRFLQHASSIADDPGLIFPCIAVDFVSGTYQLAGQMSSTTLVAWQGRFLTHTYFDQEASPATSPSDDPA